MERETLLGLMSDDTKQYADRVMEMYTAPFARFMGIEIESISRDSVTCSMYVKDEMMNSMGRGHGGVVYTLMDHTFAVITNMVHDATGQSGEVKYYRPASGLLKCTAVPINRSRSLEMYRTDVLSEQGKLVASGTFTAFVIQR